MKGEGQKNGGGVDHALKKGGGFAIPGEKDIPNTAERHLKKEARNCKAIKAVIIALPIRKNPRLVSGEHCLVVSGEVGKYF